MGGGPFSECDSRLSASHARFQQCKDSQMEGGLFSKCDSRFSAVHVHYKSVQELHGLRAVPLQNGVIVFSAAHIRFRNLHQLYKLSGSRPRNGVEMSGRNCHVDSNVEVPGMVFWRSSRSPRRSSK
eukprot:8716059-Pyramimonas_sp.AAC.1